MKDILSILYSIFVVRLRTDGKIATSDKVSAQADIRVYCFFILFENPNFSRNDLDSHIQRSLGSVMHAVVSGKPDGGAQDHSIVQSDGKNIEHSS